MHVFALLFQQTVIRDKWTFPCDSWPKSWISVTAPTLACLKCTNCITLSPAVCLNIIFTSGTARVHILMLSTKIPRLFQDFPGPPKRFSGLWRSPVMFRYTDRQQLLTLYIQFESTINHEMINTRCTETVQLARSKNTQYKWCQKLEHRKLQFNHNI